jgi:hypothetical protein
MRALGSAWRLFLKSAELLNAADVSQFLYLKPASFSLIVLLSFLMLPEKVQAQFTYTNGLNYAITNGTIMITGYTGPGGAVTIPEKNPDTASGLPVTSIGYLAFYYNNTITDVTVPDSVTNIGDSAFSFCTSLTNVTIGNSVTSIGELAFGNCYSVASFTIPKSVVDIGRWAFSVCSTLTEITVDPQNAFYSSVDGVLFDKSQTTLIQFPGGKAETYTIPTSVTSIENVAFASCNLTGVIIPNSVTNIGDDVFQYCTKLTTAVVPKSVVSIGVNMFTFCFSLTNVIIEEGVPYIADGMFEGCSNLTYIVIPDSVANVGIEAFWDCPSLTEVVIGNGVTNIDTHAFFNCSSLKGVYFKGNAPSVNSYMYAGAFDGDTNATIYYLPGTTGWSFNVDGIPIALWLLPNPLILNKNPNFGLQTNGFSFIISWATNAAVVTETCTNLINPVWIPVATNNLTAGSAYFSDPQWANYPNRFYRLRSP